VLTGNGDGTFQSALSFPAGLLPVSIAAADFTGDGTMDLVAADVNANAVSVLLGSALVFSPTSLNFGNVNLGVGSSPQTVTVTNAGASTLTISSIATNPPFSQTNTCGSSLSAGANCSVSVVFTPTAAGTANGSLMITDSAAGSPQSVVLSGNGNGATVSFSPSSLNFGNQTVNSTSAGQTVTMTNIGNATLNITSITASGQFAIAGSTCGTTLTASSTCSFTVTFTPTQTGTVNGNVTLADNGYPSPQSVPLTGVGTQGTVVLSPTSLTFGVQLINTSSPSQAVTLTNQGTAPITITSISNLTSFTQTNNCGTTVGVGASCNINVTFKPANVGTLSGTINVYDNAVGSPQTISVTGTGTQVTLIPNSLNFGSVNLGTTSSAMAVSLTNVGSTAVTVYSSTMGGANPTDFAQTNNCGASVAAGATCVYDVTFTPGGTGVRSATLSINDSGGASPQIVNLSGTGGSQNNGPAVTFNPTGLNFGNQNYKVKSAVSKVTLTNTGSAALTITTIAATGDFAQTNTCPSSLTSGANCTISVTFTPTAVGYRTGSLTVTDNAPDSPQSVPLTGTGVGAVAGLSPASMTFAVQLIGTTSAAQTATLSNTGNAALSITSIVAPTNFAETNNCGSSLAAGATCTVNVTFVPTKTGVLSGSVSVNDNSAGSASQKVSVSGTGTAMNVTPASLNFGSVNLGSTSAAQVVSVTNVSSSSVSITSVTVSGANSSDFGKTNNCPSTLNAGATCTVSVTSPPAAQERVRQR
jgi:hypothetical protein